MSRNANLVPLSELEGYRSDTLAWDLTLPEYVPSQKMGVDVQLLERDARWGGINHLNIAAFNGNRSRTDFEATSMSSDGAASAGMKVVKTRAESVKVNTAADGNNSGSWISEYWWGRASIDINTTELGDRVLDHARRGGDVRDRQIWARYLNRDLKAGLSRAVRQQLLGNVSSMSKTSLVLAFGMMPSLELASPIRDNTEAKTVVTVALASAVAQDVGSRLSGSPLSERRLSLIPGYQLDRLFIAQALIKSRKLIKSL